MPFTDMKNTAGFTLCWSSVAFVWMLSLVVMLFVVHWYDVVCCSLVQAEENLRCSGFHL